MTVLNWRQAVEAIQDVRLDTVDIGDHCWHVDRNGALRILRAIGYLSLVEAQETLEAAQKARDAFASADTTSEEPS